MELFSVNYIGRDTVSWQTNVLLKCADIFPKANVLKKKFLSSPPPWKQRTGDECKSSRTVPSALATCDTNKCPYFVRQGGWKPRVS